MQRHSNRKVFSGNNIAKPSIRRLARRGGVKRIGTGMYENMRGNIKEFVTQILCDAINLTDHARRKTVTVQDMIHALKLRGADLYV